MKSKALRQSGIALVIVLGFLVIISALAVAFFSSVTTELKASRNFASVVTTRQLAESVTQIVTGQIRNATDRANGCWASQPGMIRVFRTGSNATSRADVFVKLYSSNEMIVSDVDLHSGAYKSKVVEDYAKNWNTQPAFWTDLNSPILVANPADASQQVPRFPIIDPRAYAATTPNSYTTPTVSTKNVEGFWYDVDSGVNGIKGPGDGEDRQLLPMPVRWIYVLQDGTLTAPSLGSGATAEWAASTASNVQPSRTNPIVGRIAFWTDDETCKVNLNTAAGFVDATPDNVAKDSLLSGYSRISYAGSYWDTPRFYQRFDRGMPYREGLGLSNPTTTLAGTPLPGFGGLALCQLLQNEFQRYPGHPATTSLGLIFGNYLTSEQLYAILPRIGTKSNNSVTAAGQSDGSTKGGTKRIIPYKPAANDTTTTTTTTTNVAAKDLQVQPGGNRLYASVDELLFANPPNPPSFDPNYRRVTNDQYLKDWDVPLALGSSAITPQLVDKLRFFLTTQSRAPELNLFGQPRVAIWPVRFENPNVAPDNGTTANSTTVGSGLNSFDNLMLFCSTIGTSSSANTRPNTMTAPTDSLPNPPSGFADSPYRYLFTRRELPTLGAGTNVTKDATAMQYVLPSPTTVPSAGTDWRYAWLPDVNQPRNKQLMSYLQTLTNKEIPGFGGKFSDAAKYGTDNRNQILTEIFDYIRCANLKDTTTATIDGLTQAKKFTTTGLVIPSKPDYLSGGSTVYQGSGRFPTIYEASLVFYYAGPKLTGNPQGIDDSTLGNYAVVDQSTGVPTIRNMGAFLLFSTFNPMQGFAPITDPTVNDPKLSFEIDTTSATYFDGQSKNAGLAQFRVDVGGGPIPLGFESKDPYISSPDVNLSTTVYRCSNGTWGGRNQGGYEGFMHTLVGQPQTTWAPYKIRSSPGAAPRVATGVANAGWLAAPDGADAGGGQAGAAGTTTATQNPPTTVIANQEWYQFQTKTPVPVPSTVKNFKFYGGNIYVNVKYGGQLIQRIKLNFPDSNPTKDWPVPRGEPTTNTAGNSNGINLKNIKNAAGTLLPAPYLLDVSNWVNVTEAAYPLSQNPTGGGQVFIDAMKNYYWSSPGSFYPDAKRGSVVLSPYIYQTRLQASWSFASRLAWSMQQSYGYYQNSSNSNLNHYQGRWQQIVQPGDTIRSVIYCDASGAATAASVGSNSGDLRLAALTDKIGTGFYPHPDYFESKSRACLLHLAQSTMYFPPGSPSKEGTTPTTEAPFGNHVKLGSGERFYQNTTNKVTDRAVGNLANAVSNATPTINGITRSTGGSDWGDFDTGAGNFADGPYLNKPDEGNVIYAYQDPNTLQWRYPVPYFDATWSYEKPGNTFTSPSRQIPSPGMFGSLPSRVFGGAGNATPRGWETLSFSPIPAGANSAGPNHPGNTVSPPDHLLMDLFWMPVVEPYPISEPFSTAGKVNLNYKIAPFDYITRSTALRSAIQASRVPGIDAGQYYQYKNGSPNSANTTTPGTVSGATDQYDIEKGQKAPVSDTYRWPVDRDQTIKAIDDFLLKSNTDPDDGFFKSASQICERYLYPLNSGTTSDAAVAAWFAGRLLAGDNVREKPYADLYPRVTTKSNTYTVHMRVQTLRQIPRTTNGDYKYWYEGKDSVLGEYRGSTTIERYIDPGDVRFDPSSPDRINPDTDNLEKAYRFRSIINKKFTPH
jgi:hypothetical protein